jgi:hypothetical protein
MNMDRTEKAWINLAHDRDQCEYSNTFSGSIKCWEMCHWQLLKKDLSAWK